MLSGSLGLCGDDRSVVSFAWPLNIANTLASGMLCKCAKRIVKNICKNRKEGLAISRRGVHIAPLVG